jgi:PAS domain S-box-containing protein
MVLMEEEKLKQNLHEMSLLNKFGRLLNASILPEQVVETAINIIIEALCPDLVLFFLKKDETLQLQASGPCNSRFVKDSFPTHMVGECLCGLAASQAMPVYCHDIYLDSRCTWEECKKSGLFSFAALPLMDEKEVIGILGLASKLPRDFEKHADFLEILVMEISIAFRNSLLFQKLTDHASELEKEISVRKHMEQTLQEKEEQLRGITDNIPGIVYQFYADRDGNMGFYYVSERSEEITGLKNTPLDNYFQRFTECVLPEYREIFLSSIKEVIIEKKKWDFEGKILKPSGEEMWFRGISRPEQVGQELVFNGLLLDITEQKQAEEALKKGEKRYFSLLEHAPFGVHLYELEPDRRLIFLWANHVANRILGIDHSFFTGKTIEECFPLLAKTKIPDSYRNVAYTGTSFTELVIYEDEQGITGAFDVHAFQTVPNRMAALFLDVTEKTKAEKSLKDSETRFRNIAEQLMDVIYMTDLMGRITYISPGSELIFGWSAADMTGNLLANYLPDFEIERTTALVKEIIDRGQAVKGFDLKFRHRRGNLFDAELSIAFLRSGDTVTGTVGVIRDVTERKRTDGLLRMNESRVSALLEMSRITGKEEKTLIDFSLEKAIELTGSKIGYLAFMDKDETVLTIYSWSKNVMEQCFISDKPLEYPLETTGLWGESVRQRKAFITNDYSAENPWKKGFPKGHVPVSRHMNIPLFDGDKIVLVAGLGNKEEPYGEEDVRQLTFLMDGMWKIIKASRAEKSLRESEERYRFLVQNSNDIVSIVDERGIITYVSPSVELIGGYKPSELDGTECFAFVHTEDRPKVMEVFMGNMKQYGIPHSVEYRFRHVSGQWLDFESSSVNLLNSPGIRGILINTRDITQRRKAERETAEWKNRYELLALSAGNVIYDYDLLTDEIVWGGSLNSTLGYEPEDMAGGYKQWKELLHPDERERIFSQFTCVREAGSLFQAEYRFRHKNGHYILLQDTGYPLVNDNGRVIKYIGVLIDMTEPVKLKEEREHLEEQLRQAQKMESIGRLAGGVAHDFNNLLTPILCYAELLRYTIHPNDERFGQLNQIADAAKKARDLTRQLLAFSRRQSLQVKSVDLVHIVSAMEKLLTRTIRENIQLIISHTAASCPVMADTGQVEQILMNLAVNAQDAMPEGGVMTIRVSQMELDETACMGRPDAKPGSYGLLVVSDTGCGMDEETQKRIFEPFFSTKGEAGTGLGLATVYGIVKQHQGNIWVYSEPGSGTCFKIFLPASESFSFENEQRPDIMLTYGGVETVLLVEDDGVVRDIARAMLEQNGYKIIVASSGEEALKMIEDYGSPIDLLLTDVIMPGMNGKELYTRLLDSHQETAVLFMSGYTDNIISSQSILDRHVNFIEKPFSIEGLTSMVRSVLDRKKK